jgi:hypothetical protein
LRGVLLWKRAELEQVMPLAAGASQVEDALSNSRFLCRRGRPVVAGFGKQYEIKFHFWSVKSVL